MLRNQGAWFSALLTVAFAMASCLAGAQTPNYPTITDYPLGGGSTPGQNNHNGSPTTSSPGFAYLGWYAAYGLTALASTVVVDNTDFLNTTVAPFIGGPYDYDAGGWADSAPNLSASNNVTNSWASPTFANEAAGAVTEIARAYAVGTLQANFNLRYPPYSFTDCTPSAQGTDPTVAATPADLRFFEWNYRYPTGGNPSYVSVSVNIPQGPTQTSPNGYSFPERYYVYQVFYYDGLGNRQNYVQVVDSYASGVGYFQLGGANGVFPVNSPPNPITTPAITVRLLNTVPRDPNTGLLLQLINGATIPPNQEALVKQFLVYADAAQFNPSFGSVTGSVTSSSLLGGSIRATMASNVNSSQTVNGVLSFFSKGVVEDYLYNNTIGGTMLPVGVPQWKYSPLEVGPQAVNVDNPSANWSAAFQVVTGGPATHQGANYLLAPVGTVPPPNAATVTYTPNLVPGTYQIYAFIPGNATGQKFATQVQYDILEGANDTQVTVNQSLASGWVQIGTRRFDNNVNGTGVLKVVVSNYSPFAGDAGTNVYSDAIRFVGASDVNITATPIHAQALIAHAPGATPTLTDVVVACDENGVIHCLDATGNANGTTTEYWSYPSTPNANTVGWTDPNLDSTKDTNPIPGGVYDGSGGTLLAEMPTGFGMSSGIVQRIGNNDFLYVTTTNGRVYCISMAGRGDFIANTSSAGTTMRVWTYPATYPSAVPFPSSNLGSFVGSPAFATLPSGANVLYVPTMQGRMYALDATGAGATTTPIWTYPPITQPTIGPIAVTPSVDNFGGNAPHLMLFFGTETLNDNPAQFFALNATNGNVDWTWSGIVDPNTGVNNPFFDFLSSPCTVSGAILNASATDTNSVLIPTPSVDTVYTINSNGYVYAFNGETGAVQWQSNELNVNAQAALSYAVITTYDSSNGAFLFPFPMLIVPATSTGFYYGLFARTEDVNVFGDKLAWGVPYAGATTTSAMSNSNGWLYGADSAGYLYAYDAIFNSAVGYGPAGIPPLIAPDNPIARSFATTKVRIINQTEYNALQAGGVTYQNGTPPNGADPRNPVAFDWGESAYVEVYDFPYTASTANPQGNPVPPPIVNITITTEGHSTRTVPVVSQQFVSGAPNSQAPGVPPNTLLDGYAVYRYAFLPSGSNAVPPGSGSISVSISTYSAATNGALSTVMLNPAFGPAVPAPDLTKGWSQLAFIMANPLAVDVAPPSGSGYPDQSLGYLHDPNNAGSQSIIGDPTDQQNAFNGSFNLPNSLGYRWDLLQATPGEPVGHGQSASITVNVYDRSMLGLIYPAAGIPNVFADTHDFGWQGDAGNITSQLNTALFPNMEDLPINFPNNSLDYPNITRDSVKITANPTGNAQNPFIGQGVTLNPPLYNGLPISPTNPLQYPTVADRIANERGVATPFLYQIQVPRFQPANEATETASKILDEFSSNALSQGYTGRFNVYANANGNVSTQLITTGPNVDTYRSFNLSLGVAPDWNIVVSTPNVDLGPVSAGQGYNPSLNTTTANGTVGQLSPLNTYYQPYTVLNEGNVNLLNVRLVKASSQLNTNTNTLVYNRWGIFSPNNDTLGFLDSYMDVWSSIDAENAPLNPVPANASANINQMFLQKARVADLVPTSLSPNPQVRVNPNLGNVATNVFFNPNSGYVGNAPPVVGVSVPIGLPVGEYSQMMRVVENLPSNAPNFPNVSQYNNEILDQVSPGSYEAYSDPGFNLSFTVTETRLTGNAQGSNDAQLEYLTPTGNAALGYSNVQPTAMRDPFGSLVTAWVSNRPVFSPTGLGQQPQAVLNPSWKIFLAGIGNSTTFAGLTMTTPGTSIFPTQNPLADIDFFKPFSPTTWFNPSNSSTAGYPNLSGAQLTTLFLGATPTQTIASVSFGSPAFPNDGQVDPLFKLTGTTTYTDALMGFVGEAQLARNGTGAANAIGSSILSRLFLAEVQTAQGSGAVSVGPPVLIAADDSVRKGKPSIVQRSNNTALVFYPGTSANASDIYYTQFNGTTASTPYPLDFGSGWSTIDGVSAEPRVYYGAPPTPLPIVELTFTGKLRGEPTDEVFIGRLLMTQDCTQLAVDGNGNPQPFMDLPAATFEKVSATTTAGVYRSRGIDWDTTTPIHLVQVSVPGVPNAGIWTNVLMDGYPDPNFTDPAGPWNPVNYVAANDTHTVDRTTGIIAYDTRLGGKAYIDPALGTIKFVGGIPSPAAVLRLSYQGRFLRVSEAGAAYSSPTGMFDGRVTSDPLDLSLNTNPPTPASFVWRRADGSSTGSSDSWATGPMISGSANLPITNDRYVFTYNKAPAAGSSQAPRPYMVTRRFGIPLTYPIYVAPNGVPGYVRVEWLLPPWGDPAPPHYYQIDPANGKIYFESIDEGASVRITYQPADPATGAIMTTLNNGNPIQEFATVGIVPETVESPILIAGSATPQGQLNGPVNEQGLNTFLDPFNYTQQRRPPLMWLFWSSTRNGVPDVYFETLSPMLIPRPVGVNQ